METDANTRKDDSRTEDRAALKVLLVVALGLAALLGLAYFALLGVHAWALRRLGEKQREALRTLVREPFVVPPEWRDPKPYTQGLIDALAAWDKVRSPVSDPDKYPPRQILGEMPDRFAYDIETANEIHADAATSLSLLTATDSAALEAMIHLLRQPDFCLDVLDRPPPHDWVNGHEFNGIVWFWWDLPEASLVPYDLAARGEMTSATETATELLDLGNESLGRSIYLRWPCSHVISRSALALAYIATHTDDTTVSRAILRRLGSVELKALRGVFRERDLWCDLWYTHELRRLSREGFPVDFVMPVIADGFDRSIEMHYSRYRDQQLHSIPVGDPRRKSVNDMPIPYVVMPPDAAPMLTQNPLVRALARVSVQAAEIRLLRSIFYMGGDPLEPLPENSPQLGLDLARLRIATYLFHREKGRYPLSARDLVPEYLPAEPLNPLTGKSYLWDPSREAFHSGAPHYIYTRRKPRSGRM